MPMELWNSGLWKIDPVPLWPNLETRISDLALCPVLGPAPEVPDVCFHLSPRLFTCRKPSPLVYSLASYFFMGAQVPFPQRVREHYIPNPKLTFYEQCREVMRFR